MKQINWTRILTIMLVVLATLALLYVLSTVLLRFTHAILIFVMGAMIAYVLSPIVNSLAVVVRMRWLAILLTYILLAFLLFVLGVMLFTPFVQQSQSLIDNLHTPSAGSLKSIGLVQSEAARVKSDLQVQKGLVVAQLAVSQSDVTATKQHISQLEGGVRQLSNGLFYGPSHHYERSGGTPAGRQSPSPEPQTKVPPSYVTPIRLEVQRLNADYASAMLNPAGVNSSDFQRATAEANNVVTRAAGLQDKVSKTPILLLRAQAWLDDHSIAVDLHDKFGDAARQVSDQSAVVLDNAVTILSEAANLLLNTILILIVTFYFLSDGRRMIHAGVGLIPRYQEQAWFFMLQLDKVLGGYIRGQLFLSALAGFLGGAGAAALGVPYPLLIGIITFLLQTVPVVGPLFVYVPAVAIALFFTTPLTTLLLFIWFAVFQQVVTNFLGPKIMGTAVGIHPLEAIAAVLVGYPLGGFLGAFLAVPLAGIIHILVRELYGYFALGRALPSAPVTVPPDLEAPSQTVEPATRPGSETRPAAS